MCEFTKKGFQDGCRELGVETCDQLKSKIPLMRKELQDPKKAKQIYQFTFNFAKVENQKNLALETAIAFWDLLMADRFSDLELWKEFLLEKHGKAISKDTWNLVWTLDS
jgi:DCN1-like protein 1/2